MKIKLSYLALLILFFSSFVFSAVQKEYYSPYDASYDYYTFYDLTDSSFALRIAGVPKSDSTDYSLAYLYDKDYHPSPAPSWVTGSVCSINIISTSTVSANFDTTMYSTYLSGKVSPSILNVNYYMNTKIEYVLYKGVSEIAVSPTSVNVLVPPTGTSYTLENPFTESYVETTYGAGSYQVKAKATPIDGKCPSVSSRYSSPVSSFTITMPLPVITSFTANPGATIIEGQPLYFNWESTNAISCELKKDGTQLISATSKLEYSVTALPSPGSSAVYKLICSNSQGSVFQDKTITVNQITYSWEDHWGSCSASCGSITTSNTVEGTSSNALVCRDDSTGLSVDHSNCNPETKPALSSPCSVLSCNYDGDDFLNEQDYCPAQHGIIQYQGCPYEYSIKPGTTCFGEAVYIESTNTLYNTGDHWYCGDMVGFGNIAPNLMSASSMKPASGSGVYSVGVDNDGLFCSSPSITGACTLRHNENSVAFCMLERSDGLDLEPLKVGEIKKYFKYKKVLKKEYNDDESSNLILLGNTLTPLSYSVSCDNPIVPYEFRFNSKKALSSEYDNLIRNANGELVVNDEITIGKLSCDSIDDTCSLQTTPTALPVEVNLADIPQTRTAEIKIIKDGTNIRNDTIDISLIAMHAHKIQRFTSDEAATNFIAKSYDIMTKFNITKNLTYNSLTDKTTVRIVMNNIPESDNKNLTIYMIVDKSIANSLEDISNIEKGDAEFFVVDKDPIIGWYFNESGSDEEIGYEVDGESEGGTIIITQTPILYNEGELIINYRETDCSLGELTLFELDNLIDSKVYQAGSSQLYKVCLTHLDSNVNLYLNNLSNNQSIDVMSYTNTQNASSNPIELTNKITLSTDNSSLYFDVRVQKENPSGNYSCIGSLDLVNQTSLFGDCGYNEDARVWIHLGDDYNGPETTLSYPGLAHTLKVTLTAFEPTWESGVKNISYRVLEDNQPVTTVEDDTISFMVTCPNDWNCKKTVEYYAYDKAGNKEENKTKELLLIDKGSACQSDCTAKPSPNRYLKECSNLNSCEFYQFNQFGLNDGGDYVANQCDYLAIGSWATYNETHELLCPKGPFRESKFTNTRVNAIDESNCENMLKTPYPVIFDGENIIMNVVSCINYEE